MVVMFKMLMFRLFVSTLFDAPFGMILHFQLQNYNNLIEFEHHLLKFKKIWLSLHTFYDEVQYIYAR